MTRLKKSAGLVFVILSLLAAPLLAAQEAAMGQEEGEIQELDFANHTLVISGVRYHMAIDSKVEIGGSYGAYTMLRNGMKVAFKYNDVAGRYLEIYELSELPADHTLFEM